MADPRPTTPEEDTAFFRIPLYNIRDGGEGTDNPYGFGEGGYIDNQMRQANDVQIVGRYARDMAQIASDNVLLAADQVRLASAQAALADEDAGNTKADRIATGQDRAAAAGSAGQAAASAARFQGTSTTARTPAIGALTFTTEAGKAFDVGTWLTVQSRGTAGRWAFGKVTAYAGTSVTLDVVAIGPTVSAGADWNLLVVGGRGAQGIQGIQGNPGADGATPTPAFDYALNLHFGA